MPKVFSPLQYRRDRAVIAFKETVLIGPLIDSADAAIRSATRVRITDDIVTEFGHAWHAAPQDGPPGTRRRAGLKAAFESAGFEVID
jgi:hypothetical protein